MGTALILFTAIAGVICTIGIGLLKDEVAAWLPRLTSWIIRCAARRLPDEQHERYSEEWASHVADYPGNLSRLFQSLMCFRGSLSLCTISFEFKVFAFIHFF
jgi:hypothetical protein